MGALRPAPLPLAAAMIVRDEAATVARAIQSVAAVAAQLVVVDTGSTDATPRVAASLGAELYCTPWTDDFAAARNHALKQVRQPWVLMLDADEELVAEDLPALRQALEAPVAEGYNLRVVSLVGTGGAFTDARVTRLFRTGPHIQYRGRVHEQVADSIVAGGGRVASLDVRLLHTGYLPAAMEAKQKQRRNLALLERAAADEPDSPYWLFQLGQTRLALGQVAEARAAYAASAARLAPGAPLAPVVAAAEIRAAAAAEDFRAAEDLARGAIAQSPAFTDLHWLLGLVLLSSGSLAEARACFQHCLALGPPQGFLQTEVGVGSYLPKTALADVAQREGQPTEALAWILSALKDQPGRSATWVQLEALTRGTAPAVLAQHLSLVLPPPIRHQVLADVADLPQICRAALEFSRV